MEMVRIKKSVMDLHDRIERSRDLKKYEKSSSKRGEICERLREILDVVNDEVDSLDPFRAERKHGKQFEGII